jgi:hypothetical protein
MNLTMYPINIVHTLDVPLFIFSCAIAVRVTYAIISLTVRSRNASRRPRTRKRPRRLRSRNRRRLPGRGMLPSLVQEAPRLVVVAASGRMLVFVYPVSFGKKVLDSS